MNPEPATSASSSSRPFLLAGRFLLPLDPTCHAHAAGWCRAGRWLPVWGLAIGIVYAIVFTLAWRWFGQYMQIRFVPMAAVLAVDACFFGHRLLSGAVLVLTDAGRFPGPDRTEDSNQPHSADLSARVISLVGLMIVLLLLKYAMLLTLPIGAAVYPADWRQHMGPLWPGVIDRPLILMPLWGRWAIMLALIMGRSRPDATWRISVMGRGLSLRKVMPWWLAITVFTVLYVAPTGGHTAWAVLIGMSTILVGYLGAFLVARRQQGQDEYSVMAVGLLGEFVFLAAYLPVARLIYGY